MTSKISSTIIIVATIVMLIFVTTSNADKLAAEERDDQGLGKFSSFFSLLRRTSRQGVNIISDLAVSIPFSKILLSGAAILSLLLIFLRVLIVLGPILLLGTLARESTDATDFLKMMIEFYNQVVAELENQANVNNN